jgi:hypothetical protein
MQLKVCTSFLADKTFSQEVTITEGKDFLLSVMKFIVDTRDQQIRDALVELGWTPPKRAVEV